MSTAIQKINTNVPWNDLIQQVEAGDEVILTKNGRRVARLVPESAAVQAQRRALIARLQKSVAESLVVSIGRGFCLEMIELIEGLSLEIVPVTAKSAQKIASAYRFWGKGMHPARLNYGDCCAYALARQNQCPLVYVGTDFAQTDVRSAIRIVK